MVDINKYLESQLALTKQKYPIKTKKNEHVSEKSKEAAEVISKKQEKIGGKDNAKGESKDRTKPSAVINISDNESDEEYLPSCDDEEDVHIIQSMPSKSRTKKNIKKIIDDGDTELYNKRISNWKKNLEAACSGNNNVDVWTADILYILNGHKDYDQCHELQNGLKVPNYIWKQLYKYQRVGVKWLWELHQLKSGGLLGDEMGLGKTVQIIAYLYGLAKTDSGTWGGLGPSIIIAPATVIYQWVSHFHHWSPTLRIAVLHHSGSHCGNYNKLIRDIHNSHGIILITYAGIVKYSKDLMARKWHYIILDEGHKIRNPDTQVSKYVKKFETPHRILITGSPMQNSLQELWSLFDFMRPGLLGTYAAFMEHFAVPITQGGYANATEFQEATALEIAKALKNMITPYLLRRTKAEVQEHIKLPEKNEQVLFCGLTQEQRDLYMGYLMSGTVRSILDKDNKYGDPLRAKVLVALSTLRKICNHPDLYLYEAHEETEDIDTFRFGHWRRCGKMKVVNSLLKIWHKQGHRALIFSQSRAMLCLLEQYLQKQEYQYLKMDGSVSVSHRQSLIKTFNENKDYLVFLATTRVGGLGVNLTGADRVVIYDPDWNPATDNQAKERAWRIGQERNVTVYRLLCAGTIEEKIYQRQIFKHFLSNKIFIDPNQKNVFTTSTLQSLFNFEEPNCDGDTETASLFKHTKLNVNDKFRDKNESSSKDHLSFSRKKVQDMRKMAQEISKRIAMTLKTNEPEVKQDPRDKYKKKREQLVNPPIIEEPDINLLDDKLTNVAFENVLSELDIINMHSKKDYEEKMIKKALTAHERQKDEDKHIADSNNAEKNEEKHVADNNTVKVDSVSPEKIKINNECETICEKTKNFKNKHSRKRKHLSISNHEIDNLVCIEKVKKKKKQHNVGTHKDDDDYVLSKLFAKANVKSALQHDIVVGLAEKEKRYRLKEAAEKKAKDAIKAIKKSSK